MNIFHQFTLASLKKNRVRTLVTVIGIVLSMALMTAVIEGANSGLAYLFRREIAQTGAFHGFWCEVSPNDVSSLAAQKEIKKTAVTRRVGYAKTDIRTARYLRIEAMGEGLTELLSVRLTAGRLPENGRELILPDRYVRQLSQRVQVGDTITLSVGQRTRDGQTLPARESLKEDELLTDCREQTYTVVGFFEKLDSQIEGYDSPSFIALTAGDADGAATVFFTVKHPSGFYNTMIELEESGVTYDWVSHQGLLRYSGSFRNDNIARMLYGLVAILVILIAFGSISLIYNSFSISVSERTRQFGILKSVGATKKQIRGAVLYEGLVLCGIGIPLGAGIGCAGIGITLYCLRDSFGFIFADRALGVQMKLVISWAGLGIAALLCLLITLISAWIPARRALSVSPISAIRQSADVRIRAKEVKTSRLTKKLFGFEGMMASKNFKRNRKRYRSTVVSLFLSVTLFISAAAFCNYLTGSVKSITSGTSRTDIVYSLNGQSVPIDEILSTVNGISGVTRVIAISSSLEHLRISEDALSDSYREAFPGGSQISTEGTLGLMVHAVPDAEFLRLARENGRNGERLLRADEPMALLYNFGSQYVRTADSTRAKWFRYTLLKPAAVSATYESERILPQIDGNTYTATSEDGFYLYLNEADTEAYRETYGLENGAEKRKAILARAKKYTAAEALIVKTFRIGDTVETPPFGLAENQPFLIYPFSRIAEVTGEAPGSDGMTFCIEASDHAAVYDRLRATLSAAGFDTTSLVDKAAETEAMRSTVTVVNVFSYGFIILISLIAVANVFNTISTNIALRRREFAMLKSVGLTSRSLRRMLNYECLIYGFKGLAWGLPVSFLATLGIWAVVGQAVEQSFSIPWAAVAVAVGSVFAVVFATMLYAMSKLRRDNPIDALKNENL